MAQEMVYRSLALDLPADWDNSSIYLFKAPSLKVDDLPVMVEATSWTPNLTITREANLAPTVDDYVAGYLAFKQQQELPGFRQISQRDAMIAGERAIVVEFTFEVNGVVVQQMQVVVGHDRWYYVCTFSSLPAYFEEHRPIFDGILSTLRFS